MQCGQAMRLRLYTLLPVAVTMADLLEMNQIASLPASDLLVHDLHRKEGRDFA